MIGMIIGIIILIFMMLFCICACILSSWKDEIMEEQEYEEEK